MIIKLIKENFSIYPDNLSSISIFKQTENLQYKLYKFYRDNFTGLHFFKATLKLFKSDIFLQVPSNISQLIGPKNDRLSVR